MRNEIEFDWYLIGAKLANSDDAEQSQFFSGFAKELDSWETHAQKEMQMCCVNSKLKDKVKEILKNYLPMLWYKDGE